MADTDTPTTVDRDWFRKAVAAKNASNTALRRRILSLPDPDDAPDDAA